MNDATYGCIFGLMKISLLTMLCTSTPRDLLEYDDDRIRFFFYAFYTLSGFYNTCQVSDVAPFTSSSPKRRLIVGKTARKDQ